MNRADDNLKALGSKTKYSMDSAPEVLETFENKHKENDYWVRFNCPEFTSLCPITGQPDFAEIRIEYIPDVKMVESKSLKLYLFSFRNHGDFHEDCVNIIMKDLIRLMNPKYIEVEGLFTPRGGISIYPYANYGRPGTKYEAFAEHRMNNHDLKYKQQNYTNMFENLTDRLERSFKVLKGEGKISEINVAETLKEVRRALLDADVNYKVAKSFTDTVKEKALGMDVLTSVKPGQLMVKLVHDELARLMGGDTSEIVLESRPAVILMSGLQGSGKTTFSAKLANWLKQKKNRKPLLVACDVYRPAAVDQLKVLGEQIGIPVYSEPDSKAPVDIALNAVKEAKAKGSDVVIIDTAGRLAIDEEMMNEISAIKKAVNPDETLFIVDSMTGQDAVNTAKEFNERLDFNGVVLTKLDGDTRGGAALSIRTVVDKPIKFIGTGEKMEALDVFHPMRMADRILGMGDIVSLVERAQEQYDEKAARRLQKKIAKNQFDFNDFLAQIAQIKKMGNIKDLVSMIPGIGKAVKNIDIDDNAFKSIEAIIYSMTPQERSNPEIINGSRRRRIAAGSGTDLQEVNRLLKQFEQTRKMMYQMTGGRMQQMMARMKR